MALDGFAGLDDQKDLELCFKPTIREQRPFGVIHNLPTKGLQYRISMFTKINFVFKRPDSNLHSCEVKLSNVMTCFVLMPNGDFRVTEMVHLNENPFWASPHSLSPDGNDIWFSGGIQFQLEPVGQDFNGAAHVPWRVASWRVTNEITEIK